MLSKRQFEAISKLCKSGILSTPELDVEFINALLEIKEKCIIQDTDDRTTRIFKTFISCGGISNTIKYTHNDMSHNEISETIAFRQSNDADITTIAKFIYGTSGTNRSEFLMRQVDALIANSTLNIRDEYIKWLVSNEKTDYEIKYLCSQHIFD